MTAAVASPPNGRSLRRPYLAPVPESEPPFDDELRPQSPTLRRPLAAPIDGTRGDRAALPTRPYRTPAESAAPRRSVAGEAPPQTAPEVVRPTTISSAGVPTWSSESDVGVRKTATEYLPPVGKAAAVLARALIEVLAGRRPVGQLRMHCAPGIYAGLIDRPMTGPLPLPHLMTVRVCEPADGVAEISAAFRRAERVRALAFRLEGVDSRWRITALQVG